MIRHPVLQPQPAKPAVGQIERHLVTQPPLRAEAEAIADRRHPDHRFRIDRGTAHEAIERRRLGAKPTQVENRVDPAQQVVGRDMILKMEIVE